LKSRNLIITSFFLVLFSINPASAGENITVQNAWIREAPPTIKIMAGYLQIENSSDKALTLISAESTEFKRIEFHLSQIEDGVARMQQQDKIMIASNTTFSFEPGGYHLMLFNNTAPMREGKIASIKLTFKDGETYTFDTVVKRPDSSESQNHNHNHEHHH
jgi:copper(I)-binding protein